MKNKELFDKTISILVKAYLNDTLKHASCWHCAVGNIVAGNIGVNLATTQVCDMRIGDPYSDTGLWYHAIIDGNVYREHLTVNVKKQISKTGYDAYQLAKIEYAFEGAENPNCDLSGKDPVWMYNGLMAVVDVLCEIHEANEETAKETKALFVKLNGARI